MHELFVYLIKSLLRDLMSERPLNYNYENRLKHVDLKKIRQNYNFLKCYLFLSFFTQGSQSPSEYGANQNNDWNDDQHRLRHFGGNEEQTDNAA
jgi:hypothetical protein